LETPVIHAIVYFQLSVAKMTSGSYQLLNAHAFLVKLVNQLHNILQSIVKK